MAPPLISYITFNRLGLTIKNLSQILRSTDDFELYIIDNNSSDGTWDYIDSLDDVRIKSKMKLVANHGKIYALNMNLLNRSTDQYCFIVDNDVYIETNDWISKFLTVFAAFPELGLLGARSSDEALPPVVLQTKDHLSYLQLSDNISDVDKNYIKSNCMCLSPELLKEIGYFCEENYYGDRELSYRVCNYTNFKAGYLNDVSIQMPQAISCADCLYTDRCKLNQAADTCITKYQALNKNEAFLQKNKWRFEETMRDMKSGARPAYCASLLDGISTQDHIYNTDWAMDNFLYFIQNVN